MTVGAGSLRDSIVTVRWVLIIASAYLILFSNTAAHTGAAALLLIAVFLASNLLVARLPQEYFSTRSLKVGIAAVDTVLITLSVYFAGQFSVEMLVLFLAVVILAAAGLELAVIARVTIALCVADVLLVWLSGSGEAWRSSMLLRIPFLLSAGLLYGALVEAGMGGSGKARQVPLVMVDALTGVLTLQGEAIRRCQSALANSTPNAALTALNEIANQNREMQATMGRL